MVDHDKMTHPELASLYSPLNIEREECIRLLVNATIVALQANKDVHKALTEREKEQIRKSLLKADLATLHKRIEALSVQNPAILAEAFKRSGYGITVDANGNIAIDPNGGSAFGAAGQVITPEQFEAL